MAPVSVRRSGVQGGEVVDDVTQEEIFGPGDGASDTTMLRVLDELAGRLCADGLPGRRLAIATRRAGSRSLSRRSHTCSGSCAS
ncbi:MAG: hypothetical protein M3Y73_05775 [Actinomycetota bacterium]|nr:hypothetical protein [Actinomycetota bacterium]